MCIENVSEDDLPDDIVDKFSKLATVEVSASPTGETFKPDNTEFIKVLYDFDKTLKYVKMTFKLDLLEEYSGLADTNNNAPKKKDAFAIMMKTSTSSTKAPSLLDIHKPRFTGKMSNLG